MTEQNCITVLPSDNLTMTSREVAVMAEKQHKHVLRDIDNLLKTIKDPKIISGFVPSTYGSNDPTRAYRQFILSTEAIEFMNSRYIGFLRIPNRLQEEAALKTIEQLLGVELTRQYQVGPYYIDGYDEYNDIAYEIDEPDHKNKRCADSNRQRFIESNLGCKFVRIRL